MSTELAYLGLPRGDDPPEYVLLKSESLTVPRDKCPTKVFRPWDGNPTLEAEYRAAFQLSVAQLDRIVVKPA